MSAKTPSAAGLADWPAGLEAKRAHRQALRIAFAVAAGMTGAVAAGWVLPFLAPVFAAQFLTGSRSRLRPAQAIGMVVLFIGVGQGLALVAGLLADRPFLLSSLLWLLYLVCFFSQAMGRGGQVPFLVLVVGVLTPLMELLHQDLGASLTAIFGGAVAGGALLSWIAHVLLPDPGALELDPQPVAMPARSPLRRAAANASILLAAVVLCLVDNRFSSAVVIPVTVASVLMQIDMVASRRSAVALVLVNVIGGVAASLVFAVIEMRPTLLCLFLAVFLAGLLFGAGAASGSSAAKVHAGALSTFLILLGLGISPLPVSTPESFATRIAYVSGAVLYAFWACLLLWPRSSRRSAGMAA